jgi:iron-sulfur cluster repair protein YtfE (RIC family)
VGVASIDPLGRFEHSHGKLTKLVLEVRDLIHASPREAAVASDRDRLVECLALLSEELLQHFADEEEGLFPFLRTHVPSKAGAVDRLESAHDAVCGSLVRLAHLTSHDRRALDASQPAVLHLFERFEAAYSAHSREEAALFEALAKTLDARQRKQLAALLRGL